MRVALRRIYEAAERYANPTPTDGVLPEQRSLAAVGDALGEVLLGQFGTRLGSTGEPGKGGGGVGPSKAARRLITLSEPEAFRFAVVRRTPARCSGSVLQCRGGRGDLEAWPLIVLEGGVTEIPDADDGPRIVAWLNATGQVVSHESTFRLTGPVDEQVFVAISVQDDAAVSIGVAARDAAK